MQSSCSFFSIHFVSVYVVHPYSRIDTTVVWKKLCFILSDGLDFYMINNLSIAVHACTRRLLMSLSLNETLLPRYVNLSTNFRELPFKEEMASFWLKHMYTVLSAFTWRPITSAACSGLCSWDSDCVGGFARSAMSVSVIISVGYRLLFAFFSVKPYFFHSIYQYSKFVVYTDYDQIWGSCIPSQNTSNNVKKSVSPSG